MIEAGTAISGNEGSDFTIDWDGPDDPHDPKKWDLPTEHVHDMRLKPLSTAGTSAKNGS